jgi:hypothetical protein
LKHTQAATGRVYKLGIRLGKRTTRAWEREELKNPLRNETLVLAALSGMLAWVLTLALKAAFTGL